MMHIHRENNILFPRVIAEITKQNSYKEKGEIIRRFKQLKPTALYFSSLPL